MGEVVAGVLTSHAPKITATQEVSTPAQCARFLASLELLRSRLEAARPDLLVIFANDHLQNFFLNNVPAFCIGVAERYPAPSKDGAVFLKIPPRHIPGLGAWAKSLLAAGLGAGFDFAYSCELEFWDEVSVPLHFLTPRGTVPIVPILINCVAPPLPTLHRCRQVGAFVREFIAKRPEGERVALLGSGGLSHWVGTPETGRINPDFDRRILSLVAQGAGEAIAELSEVEIEKEAGNGAQELRNWIALLGAMPGCRGEILCYEGVPDWIIGAATAWMSPG
jgi:hypothetical protein